MNENINLTKILKDCPKGWKFYSDVYGEVTFWGFSDVVYPIEINTKNHGAKLLSEKGEEIIGDGECILLPSKDQRDWSKFTAPWYKKERFDPKTLKPFDKVITKSGDYSWKCDIFSYYKERENKSIVCYCMSEDYIYDKCIPYNEETKHLVGTKEEAPKFYRYWED